MNRTSRFLIALCLLLSGLVLFPRADLDAGPVTWQRFANAYDTPTPTATQMPSATPTGGATSVTVGRILAEEGRTGVAVALLLVTATLLTLFSLERMRRS